MSLPRKSQSERRRCGSGGGSADFSPLRVDHVLRILQADRHVVSKRTEVRAPSICRSHRCLGIVSAFTLLELLIAVAIFAIVLAAINTVFYSALRLRNKTSAALEESLPLQHALTAMKRDLSNLVPPGGLLSGTLQTTVKTRMDGQVSPDFFTASGQLDDLVPWGEVQKISYLLRASSAGGPGRDLIRATTRNLLAIIQDPPEEQALLRGVENLTFSFYDGTQWQTSWDSAVQTNLPTAIKLELQLTRTNATPEAPIALVVPIHVHSRTNSTGG